MNPTNKNDVSTFCKIKTSLDGKVPLDNKLENYDILYANFIELENKHNELIAKHSNLVEEFKENVIIQSMQDMKERYERMLRTTVPKFKHDILSEKYLKLLKTSSGCTVLLDHAANILNQAEKSYPSDYRNYILKTNTDISIVKDILEDAIKSYTN
jgi:hypothetical protein